MNIMAVKMNGLSRDLIIHPGETLSEILLDRGISNSDLAIMASVPPKQVEAVSQGRKNISAEFAKAIEPILGVDSSFWINLQANYNNELAEFNALTEVNSDELKIIKSFANF